MLTIRNVDKVLLTLIEQTRSGKLKWSDDSPEPTEFQARSEKFNYFVKTRDEDGGPPYRLQIYSRVGGAKLAEVLSVDAPTEVIELYQDLYEAAERSHAGLSQSLEDEVLADLARLSEDEAF